MLDTLAMANLLDEQIPGRFALHDLLRAYAAEQAAEQEPESERHAAVRRALDYYLHTGHAAALMLEPHRDPLSLPPPRPGAGPEAIADDRQAMAWFAAEHRVLAAAINLAADLGFDRYAWQLPAIMAIFYERRGNWSDHAAWGSLGYTHSRLAHHAEAGDCYARALELHSRLGDLWSQASMLTGLGQARNAAGHTQAALAAWRKAAEILDALHDPDAEKLRAEIEKAQQEGGPLRTG
jgi:tetratricopeptide (TPR) repeat protein